MKLYDIFQKLDTWIISENKAAVQKSFRAIKSCNFKLLGQAALLESNLSINMSMTSDIDAYTDAESSIIQQLDLLLIPHGMKFDHLSRDIWMPEETEYQTLFSGQYVSVEVANPEYLLIAKAKFALEKNKVLLIEYLATEPSDLFFQLIEKYQIDLNF